jgi:hypothetical protein
MLRPQAGMRGLGVVLTGAGAGIRFEHSGKNLGFTSHLVGYVNGGDGAVVMTNGESRDLIREILQSVAAVYHWPGFAAAERRPAAVDAGTLRRCAGVYALDDGDTLTVTQRGDRLVTQRSGGPWREAYPATSSRFFYTAIPTEIEFTDTGPGAAATVELRQDDGQVEHGARAGQPLTGPTRRPT